jgi:hypothetical protein
MVLRLPNKHTKSSEAGSLRGLLGIPFAVRPAGGALPYNLTGKKQIIAAFDAQGIYANGTWQEAN